MVNKNKRSKRNATNVTASFGRPCINHFTPLPGPHGAVSSAVFVIARGADARLERVLLELVALALLAWRHGGFVLFQRRLWEPGNPFQRAAAVPSEERRHHRSCAGRGYPKEKKQNKAKMLDIAASVYLPGASVGSGDNGETFGWAETSDFGL